MQLLGLATMAIGIWAKVRKCIYVYLQQLLFTSNLAQLIKVDIAAAIQNLHIHTPTQYYSIDTRTFPKIILTCIHNIIAIHLATYSYL